MSFNLLRGPVKLLVFLTIILFLGSQIFQDRLTLPPKVLPLAATHALRDDKKRIDLPERLLAKHHYTISDDTEHFELRGIVDNCSGAKFESNIYLECGGIAAGLTSIMSQVKTCVKMAIDLRYNLVLPIMALRDSKDLTNFNFMNREAYKPYKEWFDEEHFIVSMNKACPQMKIVGTKPDFSAALTSPWKYDHPIGWLPHYSGWGRYAWSGSTWRDVIRQNVSTAVTKLEEIEKSVNKRPIVVSTSARMAFFDVTLDTTGSDLRLWSDIDFLLRLRPAHRALIKKLINLLERSTKTFTGIHYRAENDIPKEWAEQISTSKTDDLVKKADEAWKAYGQLSEPKFAYIACGASEEIDRIRTAGSKLGWSVVDKYSLAADDFDLLQAINELPFDHQGMLDLAILSISSFFIGSTNSAFSWTIAHARHASGRYQGSSLRDDADRDVRASATHLFFEGEGDYPCCL